MPVHNSEIADIFDHLADLLEIKGANRFRVRAYRAAAQTVRDQSRSMADMLEDGEDLSELPDIGEDLAGKIEEIVETGQLELLEETKEEVPEAIAEITGIPGIGPKRAKALFDELGIRSLDELKQAAEDGKIREVEGFGEKTEASIREELEKGDLSEKRSRLAEAEDFAEPLLAYIRDIDGVKKATIAGSYRRRKETVGDIDILATAKKGSGVSDRFVDYDEVEEVVSHGESRTTVILRSGLQVDLRVVPEVSYGAAMHYFTGSKAHNIACRRRAIDRDLKLNEYGLFKGDDRIAGETEEEVYEEIGLPWIPPELRENRGEIEAAEKGELPELIEIGDLRGDLHCHTTASDGRHGLAEMAEAARKRGYDYLAITDHSKSQTVAGGLEDDELSKQIDEIAELNEALDGIRLLAATEVDILEDGSLDFPDDLLKRLDLVVASVHSKFGLSEEKQTERILRAMDNPHVSIIGHPTGRIINERRAYPLNMERIVEAAADTGCALEINATPMRLDLNDVHARMARDAGARISISTDAHSTAGLANIRYGVGQARRAWLEAGDVINTRSWTDLADLLKRG
mgnify:CR=1 FL=1